MRPLATLWLLGVVGTSPACSKDSAPSPAEITDRSWTAHVLVIGAGERAKTCADAGPAMQRAFVENRQAFVDAMALDQDKAKLAAATAYIEANESRYQDIETRMEALADRCGEDATVHAVFYRLSNP